MNVWKVNLINWFWKTYEEELLFMVQKVDT